MHFKAILFDCDGTLVDSEILANQELVALVAELGLTIPLQEAVAQFTGGRMADSITAIEQRLGRPTPDDFVPTLRRRIASAFRERLQPVAGVEAVLQQLTLPFCVTSNGPQEKIALSLRLTGLFDYFQGRLFSAYDIGSWKPEPGLFLHAAQALGVAPSECAVVEDSLPGVQAGVAARMAVFGYAPSAMTATFTAAGAHPFSHMEDLLPLLHQAEFK